jgi:hypothetical protein
MTTRFFMHAQRTALFIATLTSTQLASSARADQFVLIDEMFTFTLEDAQPNSHYYGSVLNAARPVDWTSPINYRDGSVHIRTEVIDKPEGSEVTQWVICYIAQAGQGDHYGCTGSGTYTEEGVYEHDEGMHDWWQNDIIDWTQGINEMHLVLKDADDSKGFASWRPDPEHFFPTTVRITMIQVSEGDTYDPSMFPGGDGDLDAGVEDPDAGAAALDAGTPGSDDGADEDEDGSDDMTGNSGNGNGNGTGGNDHDESAPESTGEEMSGCSVGTMGQAASPHVGVMALGLSALIARARRRKRTPTS